MNDPKVFGDGVISIAIDQNGRVSLYAGQKKIGFIKSLDLKISEESPVPRIEVYFPRGETPELEQKIESHVRALAAFPWVRAIRV